MLGHKHAAYVKGPPVKMAPHRLAPVDRDWVEAALLEDVQRGQLTPGESDWGSAPFRVRDAKRKDRLVVDYRKVNHRLVRRFFVVPRIYWFNLI